MFYKIELKYNLLYILYFNLFQYYNNTLIMKYLYNQSYLIKYIYIT